MHLFMGICYFCESLNEILEGFFLKKKKILINLGYLPILINLFRIKFNKILVGSRILKKLEFFFSISES